MSSILELHWDFTDGTERSYKEIHAYFLTGEPFTATTHCLDFFNFDFIEKGEVIVLKKDGKKIVLSELLTNSEIYTTKNIRKAHNAHRLLVSGALAWKKSPPTQQPRTWVGLTDEEKESLINKKVDGAYLTVMEIIELTEAKLKEKNNG